MTARQLMVLLAGATLLAGCGRKRDWDEEIIVQVFKPKGTDVGQVKVSASQGGAPETAVVGGFSDCSANQVRVIPAKKISAADPVMLSASASKGGLIAMPVKVDAVPPAPVKLILGPGAPALEPAGSCTPAPPQPDGGTPDGGPGPDSGKGLPTGSPCSQNSDCVGWLCLDQLTDLGTPIPLLGGYCSRPCASSGCDGGAGCCEAGEACWTNTNGKSEPIDQVCLKTCKSTADCNRSGYVCTPGERCMPL
jgi:hypothetical protein